jgi:hypothetical protein
MQPPRPESATLPRDFRFHYRDGERPKTPETSIMGEPNQPSPPRYTRLRVRRRNLPNFSAPTDQFLASVAAEDVPIPTIELSHGSEDEDMLDKPRASDLVAGFLSPQLSRLASPPKTPLPRLLTSTGKTSSQRPDWYMEDAPTPEDGTSRPSSAMSNPSDWSDDSYFGGSRISRPSEEGSCTSPDSDVDDPFESPSKGKGRETSISSDSNPFTFSGPDVLNAQLRSRTRTNAPWSRDMSEHLWNTYQIYLQDPTVTPFRIGASAVPPEGVIHRVAREAKRSWKGPKAVRRLRKQRISSLSIDAIACSGEPTGSPDTAATSKSGSLTPTGEKAPRIYLRWQHSSAATRNHLRELCRRKDSTSVQRHRHLQSRSPTPFTHMNPRPKDRQRTPHSAPLSAFSTEEVALSLATSSAESMKPDGPLAKLAEPGVSMGPETLTQKPPNGRHTLGRGINVNSEIQSRRLGSPFSCRTYGPSSSKSSKYFAKTPLNPQTDIVSGSGPFLRSPVRFDQPRSLNGTQKRRAQHPLEEELGPTSSASRPSILDEQLFSAPVGGNRRRVRSRGFSLGDEVFRSRFPGPFAPSEPFVDTQTSEDASSSQGRIARATPTLLPSAEFAPRLGSPFMEEGTSNTFPRRLFQQAGEMSTIRRTHFATVHHARHSVESFDFGNGVPLQSRLRQLDQKLTEIRERERPLEANPKIR